MNQSMLSLIAAFIALPIALLGSFAALKQAKNNREQIALNAVGLLRTVRHDEFDELRQVYDQRITMLTTQVEICERDKVELRKEMERLAQQMTDLQRRRKF